MKEATSVARFVADQRPRTSFVGCGATSRIGPSTPRWPLRTPASARWTWRAPPWSLPCTTGSAVRDGGQARRSRGRAAVDTERWHCELRRRRVIDEFHSVPGDSGRSAASVVGVKSSIRNSSGASTCFGVRPPRSTLSELAITSTSHALQVGMQVAGGQIDGLTGPQAQPVQQQGCRHTGIAGVALAQLERRPGFGGD